MLILLRQQSRDEVLRRCVLALSELAPESPLSRRQIARFGFLDQIRDPGKFLQRTSTSFRVEAVSDRSMPNRQRGSEEQQNWQRYYPAKYD